MAFRHEKDDDWPLGPVFETRYPKDVARTEQQRLLTWITRESPAAARLLRGRPTRSHPEHRGACAAATVFPKWGAMLHKLVLGRRPHQMMIEMMKTPTVMEYTL